MDSEAEEEVLVEEAIESEMEVVVSTVVITISEAFKVVETVGCPEEASYFINVYTFTNFQKELLLIFCITNSLIYHNDFFIIYLCRIQRQPC